MAWEDAGGGVSGAVNEARAAERDGLSWPWTYWEVSTRCGWLVDWRVGRDG